MGIFDNNSGPALDPTTMGLLSAAFAGLQASGPSRMPTSFGQVLGQAGQAGVGAYQQQGLLNQHSQMQGLQMQQLAESLAAQKRTQAAIEQYAQSVPEKDRALFLANPGEYIKSRAAAYSLKPGEKRMIGSEVLGESQPNAIPVNLGGSTQLVNPSNAANVGTALPHTPSPSDRIALGNLQVKGAEADPFGMLGIKDIASRVGKEMYGSAGSSGGPGGGDAPVAKPLLAATPKVAQDVHGTDFLGSIPKPVADQVKALAEGRMQFPGGFAMKSPYWQNMVSMVAQYDPAFDQVNYNARAGVRRDFTSGKSAQNLTAINTAIGHLDTLSQKAEALGNTNFPMVNTVKNTLQTAAGNPAQKEFDVAKGAVANELMRVFRQVGASESEVKEWGNTVASAGSPAQLNGSIKTAVELLRSRLEAIGEQYNKGMGASSDPMNLLTEKSRKTLDRLESMGEKTKTGGSVKFLGFEK